MTEPVTVATELDDVQHLESVVHDWPAKAEQVQIIDAPTYERAAELLKGIKGLRKQIESTFGPIVRKAHAAWQEAIAQRKRVEAPLELAEGTIKIRIRDFENEQERARREEEARLAAEAQRADEDARLARAAELEEAGEHEAADAILEAPSTAPPPVVPSQVPKVAGVASRPVWKAEVTDLRALARAVADGKVPIGAIQPNMKVLNQQARSLRGELRWPGVRSVCERTVAARSG